jgi:hypothetical protein
MKILITIFTFFSCMNTAYANQSLDNGNILKEILYIYYDNVECNNRVQTYASTNLVEANLFNINKRKPVQIYVTDMEIVENITWYKAKLIDGASEGNVYITKDTFEANYDGAQNYYVASTDKFSDEKLLKACISNISPPFRLLASNRYDPNHSITLTEKDFESSKTAIPKLSNNEICVRYGYYLRDKTETDPKQKEVFVNIIKKELQKRKLFVSNLSNIKQKQIQIKMNECELYASWGLAENKNESVGSWGVDTQHVYGNNVYVYTRNGRITSWQK